MLQARTWAGLSLLARADRACARAIVGIGMRAAVETKRITHVDSGTLRRSVHSAPAGWDGGAGDETRAANEDLLMSPEFLRSERTPEGPAVEVGSWLPYACAEWVGRGHPGITQGLEMARADSFAIVAQAFKEEGL